VYIASLARLIPQMVRGAKQADVEGLAARINRFDHTGRPLRHPNRDQSLNARDLFEAEQLIASGGAGLTRKEQSLFSTIKLLAELFGPNAGYQRVDFRGVERQQLSRSVKVSTLPVELKKVGRRLAGGKSELTLGAAAQGFPQLLSDEKRPAMDLLKQRFHLGDRPRELSEKSLPGSNSPIVATANLTEGVTVHLVEEPYVEWEGVRALQCLRIHAQPGDLLVTPIGVGSNMGPFVPHQAIVCDQTGKAEIWVSHGLPEGERFAVLRPSAKAGEPPTLLARAEVFSPSRKLEAPPPHPTGPSAALTAALIERVREPASRMARKIIEATGDPQLWGDAQPAHRFVEGKLPAGRQRVEVPLSSPVRAFVDVTELPDDLSRLDWATLTYHLLRDNQGRSEIAGPFTAE
jgi:hypothetical protein